MIKSQYFIMKAHYLMIRIPYPNENQINDAETKKKLHCKFFYTIKENIKYYNQL